MKFRPCIDLHNGQVVQIVGSSLSDDDSGSLHTNFISSQAPSAYAELYQQDGLTGGHVISLGKGNQDAAIEALSAFPGGMHYGGGVTPQNAHEFLNAGASHVIVTSYIFTDGELDYEKLTLLTETVGKDSLVLDLSCRSKDNSFYIVCDRWQTFTSSRISPQLLENLSHYCAEFLVHGVDVEGKSQGIQEDLIELLGAYSPIPVTYAGGVQNLEDLELVKSLGQDRVDLTIGSALDIFGGDVPYKSVLNWCASQT